MIDNQELIPKEEQQQPANESEIPEILTETEETKNEAETQPKQEEEKVIEVKKSKEETI